MNESFYNSFISHNGKELSIQKKDTFIKNIKKLDDDGMKKLLFLIKFYQQKNNADDESIIPYGGTCEDNDITFDLDELHVDLQNILYKFVELHNKSTEEESIRKVFFK